MSHRIEERGGRFHVTFAGGAKPIEKSFASLSRAKAWATRCATAKARYADRQDVAGTVHDTTLGDVLQRYHREVAAHRKSARSEGCLLRRMAREPIGGILLADLTPKALATFRNERLAVVSNQTVRNDMTLIRQTLEYCRREWGFDLQSNPAALVRLPPPGPARSRRLEPGEYEKLERELQGHPIAWAVVRFAAESAMRQGEMLRMTWKHVNLAQRMVHLPMTKNGSSRTVPLTDGAVEVLEGLEASGERVFPIDPWALRWQWNKACKASGIEDLRFHDLRHEAVSRLFEMELPVQEVALISGHKTVAMLFRYLHLMPIDLARKLKGRKRRTRCTDDGDTPAE